MPGSTARVTYIRPLQLVSTIWFQSSSDASCAGSSPSARPALLTSRSIAARSGGSAAIACATAAPSRTSSGRTKSRSSPSSARSASSRSTRRPAAMTRCPSRANRRAISAPNPDEAPVTRTIMGASIAQSHLPRPAKRREGRERGQTTSDASATGGPPARSSSVASGGDVGLLIRTANSSFGPPARASSNGPANSVLQSASSSGRSAANVASRVRRGEAVVHAEQELVGRELDLAGQRQVLLQQRRRVQRAPRQIAQPLGRRQAGALAVVEQAGAPLALVEEVVRAVADQDDARALRDVLVVGDVDRQLRAARAA